MIALVAALALAAPAPPTELPHGKPLVAFATVRPTVHLFGDPVTADVTVVADPKRIDTRRVRLLADFRPYVLDAPPRRVEAREGGLAFVRYRFRLQCVTRDCITVLPRERQTTLATMRKAHLVYLPRDGKGKPLLDVGLRWPSIELVSRIRPTNTRTNRAFASWATHIYPPVRPRYRASPALLVDGAYGLGSLLLLAALGASALWLCARRPEPLVATAPEPTPLERALALLEHAQREPDARARREALERFALELGVDGDLARSARQLAWSRSDPDPGSIGALGARVRKELA